MRIAGLLFKPATLIVLGSVWFAASCSFTPTGESDSYFYPPLPGNPRIQFLTSFDGAGRVDTKNTEKTFKDYILGKDTEGEDSIITKPYGVAIFDNRIYVVDLRAPGYVVLSLDNKIIKVVQGKGLGRMIKPINIRIDYDGTKYITDTGRNRVLVFTKDDEFLREYGKDNQFRPSDVAITEELLYVTDLQHHKIQVLYKTTGALAFEFGKAGSGEKDFFYPTNIAVSKDGFLLISDTGNFRIVKYARGGRYVQSFGEIGSNVGQFTRPKGIAVDREGRMYVVDAAFENIQIFDDSGTPLLFFGQSGNNPDSINLPADIEIDYDHVSYFQKLAKNGFKIEYLIFVTSQFGANKVNVYGFGGIAGEGSKPENSDSGLVN